MKKIEKNISRQKIKFNFQPKEIKPKNNEFKEPRPKHIFDE